jgi:formylmethanofuran dehydrogenase subunit E
MDQIEPKLGDEIPDNWLKLALKEVKAGYKITTLPSFRDKEGVEIYIYQPNSEIESKAADIYNRTFSRLVSDPEYKTKKELQKIMEDRGLWGEKQEGQVEDIQDRMKDIQFTVIKLKQFKKLEERKKEVMQYRKEWFQQRDKLINLLTERDSFLQHSVEGQSEQEMLKYKLVQCTKFADGTKVWETTDAFNEEKEIGVVSTLLNDSILFWSGLSPELITALPNKLLFDGEEKSEN